MVCNFKKYRLHFKKPSGTSRGILLYKDTYILKLSNGIKTAFGECNLFKNLAVDDREDYEEKLREVCLRLPVEKENLLNDLIEWPSIKFGVETLLMDWENGGRQIIFPQSVMDKGFTIPINCLIWMGSKEEMKAQITNKLQSGYTCIKLKIGAIDFAAELELLRYIRKQYAAREVEIRVDANGAFEFEEAKEKLKRISEFEVNYIEQPIKAGQWQEMAELVENSQVKIALDEELIGVFDFESKLKLIETISPRVLILKPALHGGFNSCDEWKKLIESQSGNWVVTSALECNIGLNSIAQYAAQNITQIPQGLGTGQLFTNNIPSPYTIDAGGLHYHADITWDFSLLQ